VEDELTPEQKFASEPPETIVTQGYLAGRDKTSIVDDLQRLGWPREKAEEFFEQMLVDLKRYHESPEARQQLLVSAQFQLLGGCLALLIAGGITAATLLTAAFAVGLLFLVIPFGLLLLGLSLVGQGWSRWRFYRRFRSLPPPARDEPR
jgi:hypothetical protein